MLKNLLINQKELLIENVILDYNTLKVYLKGIMVILKEL